MAKFYELKQNIQFVFDDGTIFDKSRISISDGVVVTDILNGDTDYTFGKAVCKQVEATFVNDDGRLTNFDFTQRFRLNVVFNNNGTNVVYCLGVFKGERPTRVKGRLIKFVALDLMQKFDISASEYIESLDFSGGKSLTMLELYNGICGFVGVTPYETSLLNGDKVFTFNPFATSDYTAREVLAFIAEANGGYARMDINGKCRISNFEMVEQTIELSDRFEYSETETEISPVVRLECYTSYSDMLCVSGEDEGSTYVISDNPLLYAENSDDVTALQPYVDRLFNCVQMPTYYPTSIRGEWYPQITAGSGFYAVNDYGEKRFALVFSMTIKWAGHGYAEYESTGNVKREVAGVEQRELESIKKKMLRATDLSTAVESYLNTQEGKASITSAVDGKFVAVEDGSEITSTAKIEQLVQQTEDDIESQISITAGVGKGTIGSNVQAMLKLFSNKDSSSISLAANALTLTATESSGSSVETDVGTFSQFPSGVGVPVIGDDAGTLYSFAKNSDGYYNSLNTGVSTSFAYGTLTFNFSSSTEVTLRCRSYGENNYDYGIISTLDTTLNYSYIADSSGVLKSFKGLSSSSYVDVTLTVPSGTHYITFKYIKDSSTSSNDDNFLIKALKTTTSGGSTMLTLKSGSTTLSSTNITITGAVTFEDLSTAGSTIINGANVTTDNLYLETVFFKGNHDWTILDSAISGANAYVRLGNQGGDTDYGQYVEIYSTQTAFINTSRTTNTAYMLKVDCENRELVPGGTAWWLGNEDYYWKRVYCQRIYFTDGSYFSSAN